MFCVSSWAARSVCRVCGGYVRMRQLAFMRFRMRERMPTARRRIGSVHRRRVFARLGIVVVLFEL